MIAYIQEHCSIELFSYSAMLAMRLCCYACCVDYVLKKMDCDDQLLHTSISDPIEVLMYMLSITTAIV